MRITAAGDVGIGTASPATKLDVNGVGTFQTGLQVVNGGAGLSFAASRIMRQMETSSIAREYVCGADASTYGSYELYTATSTGSPVIGIALTAAGNVGIGTSSPTQKLSVVQPSIPSYPTLGTASGGIVLLGDSGAYGLYVGINTSSGDAWQQVMRNDAATAYNLLLQPVGGNVGIGTTSPSEKLHVSSGNNGAAGVSTTGFGATAIAGGGGATFTGTALDLSRLSSPNLLYKFPPAPQQNTSED
jgi:hypothetical protein